MKKTKFTIIDLGIVIVFLAVVAVGIKVLGGNFGTKGETKEVYVTVLATKVDSGVSEMIKGGERVSVSYSEEAYATVVGASEVPHIEKQLFEEKGYYSTFEVEGKSDVKVLLRCDATVADTRISNGNVPLRVGEEMAVCGKGYALNGYIIEVDDGEGGEAVE